MQDMKGYRDEFLDVLRQTNNHYGTKISKIKEKINKIIEILIKYFSLINENINIINKPNRMKAKCFTKK